MSSASEVLAAQLRSPGFRAAEPGYEPDEVRDHLAMVHGLVATLERRLVDIGTEIAQAEAEAARAEEQAVAPAPDEDDEILRVVFDGQRRADEVVAEAEARATALRQQADDRIAALRDDSECRRLRAAIDETRCRLEETQEALAQADDDLRAAAEATRQCRVVIGDRLAAALADLTAMDLAMERT